MFLKKISHVPGTAPFIAGAVERLASIWGRTSVRSRYNKKSNIHESNDVSRSIQGGRLEKLGIQCSDALHIDHSRIKHTNGKGLAYFREAVQFSINQLPPLSLSNEWPCMASQLLSDVSAHFWKIEKLEESLFEQCLPPSTLLWVPQSFAASTTGTPTHITRKVSVTVFEFELWQRMGGSLPNPILILMIFRQRIFYFC